MPTARFKGVLVCSSEDKNHPASNLVSNTNKKWKCEETNLDSVYVILQLESPMKITGIDIGNEHSAFIEVSVGRTGWPVEKYKTILVSSSFMTIPDSRASENPNRVRCFAKDALMPDVASEKWELVKVTCTQGFNKHVQFGLSFVKVHTSDSIDASNSAAPVAQTAVSASPKEKKVCGEKLELPKNNVFAQFRIRSDSSDSDKESLASTSLFSKWKDEKDSPKKDAKDLNISSAAAIREASSSISKLVECTRIKHKLETSSRKSTKTDDEDNKDTKKARVDRYRLAILYDDDDENTSNPKLEKIINEDKERIERERKELLDKKKNNRVPSREEKSKKKMEPSADKFKIFVAEHMPNQASKSPSRAVSVESEDDDDVVEVKNKSPKKVDSASSSTADVSTPKTPNPTTPPAWKVKKRQSTSNEGSASKRLRKSESPEHTQSIANLMRGVVFVISGIQNPERSDLRSKGLQMGAKYKQDWEDSCTHLICAFPNTPKYKQVQGHGIIVKKSWISDCYAQKKKLPWQDYKL